MSPQFICESQNITRLRSVNSNPRNEASPNLGSLNLKRKKISSRFKKKDTQTEELLNKSASEKAGSEIVGLSPSEETGSHSLVKTSNYYYANRQQNPADYNERSSIFYEGNQMPDRILETPSQLNPGAKIQKTTKT